MHTAPPLLHAQRGIGLVGFIIGIVVGLAVALAVAIYVTKAPTPFVDKGAVRKAEQQAAEEDKLRAWDPNAPLYGKHTPATPPVLSGSAAAAQLDLPTPPDAHAPPVDREQELERARREAQAKLEADLKAQEAARREEARRAAQSEDPLGALLRSRSAGAAESDDGGFTYFVQAGAFRSQADADAQRTRLALLGQSARVSEHEQAGRSVWRVRLGPYNRKADADAAKAQLAEHRVEAALVRVQK